MECEQEKQTSRQSNPVPSPSHEETMPVRIHFRGVCLFVVDKGPPRTIAHVVLPHAGPTVIPREGTARKHLDGSEARPHYSGFAVFRGSDTAPAIRVEPLRGAVHITGGTGACTAGNFKDFAGLDKINNNGTNDLVLDLSEKDRVACVIDFQGGRIDGERPSRNPVTIKDPFGTGHGIKDRNLFLTEVWTAHDDSATLVIEDTGEKFDIGKDDRAFIYSFDATNPGETDLQGDDDCLSGTRLDDIDFKWLYQLVRPTTGKLKDRTDPTEGLLHPVGTCLRSDERIDLRANPRTPLVSTCFSGDWGDG